ncbi:MAG: ThuA domain-containing protein [Phycisphaerae bacterium]|nr:ThuA domain-containing protein [Phycisphaerae bacterium]
MTMHELAGTLMGVALVGLGIWLLPAVTPAAQAAEEPAASGGARIRTLLLTGGPVHDGKGIGDIVQAAMEKTGRFEITRVNEDLNALLAERIAPFDLVVFYWTMGEISEAQKRGLMNHIAGGKGYVTFHSGADSFREDPDYRAFVGGYFVTHPRYRTYQVSITENDSPITRGIDEFMITDEQYILSYNPQVTVLANSLHKGQLMPVLWTKDWGKGRVFYSALGHDPKACEQEMFQKSLIRGALWAAGREIPE